MFENILETKGLCKYYGDNLVVDNVDLHVKKGEIYGLLGRNGAGKTTIMKMIMGLVRVSSGEIYLFDKNIINNQKALYPRIGCLIESPGFYPNMTAYQNMHAFADLRGSVHEKSIEDALNVVGLPIDGKKIFSEFSLGMKQRLGVAHAIMNDPEFLILDEPTNGLDPIGIAEMRDFIKRLSEEREITILLSSHQLNEIEQIADTVGIIRNGRLLEERNYREIIKSNTKYIQIEVSDVKSALVLLEQVVLPECLRIEGTNKIRIHNLQSTPGEINRFLNDNGIYVNEIYTNKMNLEDYFKKITGGEGIA